MQELLTLPATALVEAPYNPRKTFDEAKLRELAESIRASGLHQPILARPLPGERAPDTGRAVTHEIVAGARRWRAAQMAGLSQVPVICRAMTDAQALEVAVIENLQRDDLSPLEEAQGYQSLIDAGALKAEDIGARIGKSRTYIYNRLKLLDLCPEGRQALAEGRIEAAVAQMLARIPDTSLQAAALIEVAADGLRAAMSTRQAHNLIQRRYMLRLDNAPFDQTDPALNPAAGPCTSCPKRTGSNPDLFADHVGQPDLCTLPACYQAKEQAHNDAKTAAVRESGATIIEGREAKSLMPFEWSALSGYLRLDDKRDSPDERPLRAIIGEAMQAQGILPVYVANPHKGGELVAVLPTEQAAWLLQAAGHKKAADNVSEAVADTKRQQAREQAQAIKEKIERDWRQAALRAIVTRVREPQAPPPALPPLASALMRLAAERQAQRLDTPTAKTLARLLDLGDVAAKQGLQDWAREAPDPTLALATLSAADDIHWEPWAQKQPHNLALVAEHLGIDLDKIQKDTRAAAKIAARQAASQAQAEAPRAANPHRPAARANDKGGAAQAKAKAKAKPKMPESKAREAIAAAMAAAERAETGAADAAQNDQGQGLLRSPASQASATGPAAALAPSVGAQVRIKDSIKGWGSNRWRGQEGQIIDRDSAGRWIVSRGHDYGLAGQRAFASNDLDVLQGGLGGGQ